MPSCGGIASATVLSAKQHALHSRQEVGLQVSAEESEQAGKREEGEGNQHRDTGQAAGGEGEGWEEGANGAQGIRLMSPEVLGRGLTAEYGPFNTLTPAAGVP